MSEDDEGKKGRSIEAEYLVRLNEVWGYFMGQKMLLERAALKYPEMQTMATLAWGNFKKDEIGESLAGVEALLKEDKGKGWVPYEAEVLGKMRAKLAEQDLSKEAAREVVRQAAQQTAAKFPPNVLMFLLSAHPKFVEAPIEEVKQGFLRRISSNGMAKAMGLKMEMQCPASWKAVDGVTPKMVWRLQSKGGSGAVASSLTVMPFPGKKELAQVEAALKMPALQKMAPKNSALISAKEMTLGGKPAGMLIYEMFNPVYPGEKISVRVVQLSCVAQGVLVQLQFTMSPEKGSSLSLNEITKRNMPLFQLMAESVQFAD